MAVSQFDTNPQKGTSVLIAGGSGLIGKYLTSLLISRRYEVSHLSRSNSEKGKVNFFMWNPEKKLIDPEVLKGIDYIINLAGANIGEIRWTRKRKELITGSRVRSTIFLHEIWKATGIPLKGFISASATGYYGSYTSDKIFTETDPPGNDFLGNTCRLWEDSAGLFERSGIRTVKIRTAVVLEKNDSALSRLMLPGRFAFLIQTGNGKQYMPWIHIDDLCNIYLKAIEDSDMAGSYNAVSPQYVNHGEFMRVLSKVMKRPVFPIPVPGSVLRAIIGEMSDIILEGSRISSEKIINSGYKFVYPDLTKALENVISE
jgi:uncharacterized protein